MPIILPVVNTPSSQIYGCDKDGSQDDVLENFFLILWKHEWTPKNQSEPVDNNSKGE